MLEKVSFSEFQEHFGQRISENFDPTVDLERIGVINQTTMLATETPEIATNFRQVMIEKHGEATIKNHFTDTKDTRCYSTNENQVAN